MGQFHVNMCHRAVVWTSDVTYVCAIGLRGLTLSVPGALHSSSSISEICVLHIIRDSVD